MRIVKILILLSWSSIIFSTPMWDYDDMQNFLRAYENYRITIDSKAESHYIPTIRTSYPMNISDICGFVANWQLYAPDSVEHGGIIEAETGELREIIQTDNTQESVIIWSLYKSLFSSGVFDSNTALSLDYVARFPAYNEEISEYSFYYPVWNSGLALLMVIYYSEYFEDTSLYGYGDSCAAFVIDSVLPLTTAEPAYNLLHCYVTAFVAGCLAQYGEYRDEPYFIEEANSLGIRAKDWAEAHPDTAFGWQIWAMSSGTLLWGLIKSYFSYYPDELDNWIDSYILPYFPEIVPSPGEFDPYIWDNSWNIWYANGYRVLNDLSPDSVWYYKYRNIVDYLIAQDTDRDGGIPASVMHGDTMDMSWVSTYLVFMGLEGVWDSLKEYDAGVIRLQLAGQELPYYLAGDTIAIEFQSANCGIMPISDVDIYLLSNFDTIINIEYDMDLGESITDTFIWIPDSTGDYSIRQIVQYLDDMNPINDTLSLSMYITPIVELVGFLMDSAGTMISGEIIFYSIYDSSEILATAETDSSDYQFNVSIPEIYTKVCVRPEFPFPDICFDSVDIASVTDELNIILPYPQVLLVQDDGGIYREYFTAPLDTLNILFSLWDREIGEIPPETMEYFQWQSILWFTGDCEDSIFSYEDIEFMSEFIDSGGKIVLTGQYILENLIETSFWDEYIHAANTGSGEPILLCDIWEEQRYLCTRGDGSAENQVSIDFMVPPDDATAWIVQDCSVIDSNVVAFSRNFSSHGKILFSSLGFEGMGKLSPAQESRTELFAKIFTWLDPAGIENERLCIIPSKIDIQITPNPFNSSCKIFVPAEAKIEIYDLRGNVVYAPSILQFLSPRGERDDSVFGYESEKRSSSLPPCRDVPKGLMRATFIWQPDETISSGIYFVRATTNYGNGITKRIVYVK
ncbi:hypothetical protein DRQ33_02440 [bacterium]|nr:MAG: hypothetical protein DRQ33_02440 [bacterium]